MMKMADSAVMRQAMPTMPRDGSTQGSVVVCGMTAAVLKTVRLQLFVMAVGVEGMLQVPERATALDGWGCGEVVLRRRRGGGPLQRPRIPGIGAGDGAFEVGPDHVVDKQQRGDGLDDGATGDGHVPHHPSAVGFVGIDAAGHALGAPGWDRGG